MYWTVKNILVVVVLVVLVAWYFRYEYVTRTIGDVSCVQRLDRFTSNRCLVSTDIPTCNRVVTLFPCDE